MAFPFGPARSKQHQQPAGTDQCILIGEIYERGSTELLGHLFYRLEAPTFHAGGVGVAAVDRAALAGVANKGTSLKLANFQASGTSVARAVAPELRIAPAVILNWPETADGWRLEGASQVNGPWTMAPGLPRIEAGQFQTIFRTEEAMQFFRLRNH